MNLIDRARSAIKSWALGSFDGGIVRANGVSRYAPSHREAMDSSTIVGACLESILDAFTDAPAVTMSVGADGEERYDHATGFAALMLAPDPLRKINGRRFVRAMVASHELDGNAYAELILDGTGTVREMRWVPWWAIEPKAERGTGLLSHYDVRQDDGALRRLEPREVLHVAKGIDPKNALKGRSPLRSALAQVLTDNECDAYCREIVANPAIVGWSVMPRDAIDPTDAELVERKIQAKFGPGGRGGVMVPHFPSEVKALGFSPADLAIDKLRLTPEARISALMNVPAIIAGLEVGLQRSTFANTEQARRYFARYKMAPLWDAFGEDLTTQVLPQTEGYAKGQRAGYDTRRIADLQPDQDALHKRARDDFAGNLVKRGEARSMIGLKSGKGDDVYFADVATPAASKGLEQTRSRLDDRKRAAQALRDADAQDDEQEA